MPSDGPSDEKQIKLESTQSESSGADDGGGGKAASVSAAGSSSGASEVRNEYHMKKRKLR